MVKKKYEEIMRRFDRDCYDGTISLLGMLGLISMFVFPFTAIYSISSFILLNIKSGFTSLVVTIIAFVLWRVAIELNKKGAKNGE